MSKTIVVVGFGVGVSAGVADKFGAEGYSVALVARSPERLAAGVAALQAKGIAAAAFPADAGDPVAIRGAVAAARAELGPIAAIHWNAYSGSGMGDLLSVDPVVLGGVVDIAVVGLLSAVQEALPDLKATKGAVLVTNGAFGYVEPHMDALGIALDAVGVSVANAAKAKLVGLLAHRLKDEGVYVGEVTIAGVVKGAGWGDGGIEPSSIADQFWAMAQARDEVRARAT
jgi:NAD(P)-dependent dehydrogenase (short-subunit alcohol dehydrogenase family)